MSYRIKNGHYVAQAVSEVPLCGDGGDGLVHRQMMAAHSDFRDHVLPVVANALGDGTLHDCECRSDAISLLLDRRAKIDYLFVPDDPKVGIFGIAVRVTNGHYQNLTLNDAQLESIKWSVQTAGAIRPRMLIHGCVETNPQGKKSLIGVALVPVDEFVIWIQTHGGTGHRNSSTGQRFYAWSFASLQGEDGCPGTIVIEPPKFQWVSPITEIGGHPQTSLDTYSADIVNL